MKLHVISLLFLVLLISLSGNAQTVQLIKSNTAPVIDGIMDQGEWDQATKLAFNSDFEVRVTYTETELFVAFLNVTNAEGIRHNTEVLIQTEPSEGQWNNNTYWFHASYSNCSAKGKYYFWEDCIPEPIGWKASTFPINPEHNLIEFRISFSKLGLKPTPGTSFKLSGKYSDPKENYSYWPKDSKIEDPATWGIVRF